MDLSAYVLTAMTCSDPLSSWCGGPKELPVGVQRTIGIAQGVAVFAEDHLSAANFTSI